MKNLPTPPNCLLIADDLTGACDAALQFRVRGARSVVHLEMDSYEGCMAEVHAFNTETRDAEARHSDEQLLRIEALTSTLKSRVVFKKIDSLLRGNPGGEIAAALKVFDCDVAIITPAFPDLGRIVREGHLEVVTQPSWKPLAVAPLLRSQGLDDCDHLSTDALVDILDRSARYISLDASSHSDLALLVKVAMSSTGKRILWAGSGGLAAALADVLFPSPIVNETATPSILPVVFCIGSNHSVTQAQVRVLLERCPVIKIDLGLTARRVDARRITDCLEGGQHVLLRVPRGQGSVETLRCLEQIKGKAAAMVMSGGDTASTICRALKCRQIEILGQVAAGLPWGRLKGGMLDESVVATKSGAFGALTDLAAAADFFTNGTRHG